MRIIVKTIVAVHAVAWLDQLRASAKEAAHRAHEAVLAASGAPTQEQLDHMLKLLEEMGTEAGKLNAATVQTAQALKALEEVVAVVGDALPQAVARQYHRSPCN